MILFPPELRAAVKWPLYLGAALLWLVGFRLRSEARARQACRWNMDLARAHHRSFALLAHPAAPPLLRSLRFAPGGRPLAGKSRSRAQANCFSRSCSRRLGGGERVPADSSRLRRVEDRSTRSGADPPGSIRRVTRATPAALAIRGLRLAVQSKALTDRRNQLKSSRRAGQRLISAPANATTAAVRNA